MRRFQLQRNFAQEEFMSEKFRSLTREQVMGIIPHRPPTFFVESITVQPGEWAVGIMTDWTNDPVLGTRKTFPQPLIIEALSEAGAVAILGLPENKGKLAVLTGVNNFKFGQPIERREEVILEAELGKMRSNYGKGHVRASVNGEIRAEGEISFGY
ncbi:MAG: 3-hydroxyacyl-[acyl-carrier-protein] dehydratase FabZ [Candidatus Levyibacteriota bacterium]